MAAAISAYVIGPSQPAGACACLFPDVEALLDTSDFLFVGSLVDDPTAGLGDDSPDEVPYTFEVERVYKGDIRDKEVAVWAPVSPIGCGFHVRMVEPIGVAVTLEDGRLSGGLCSTIPVPHLDQAASDLGVAARGPDAAPDEQSTSLGRSGTGVVLAVVLSLAALGLVAFSPIQAGRNSTGRF